MELRLREQMRTCLRKAEEARTRAEMSSSPEDRLRYQSLEAMWSALAKTTRSGERSKVYRSGKARARKDKG
jgi:hypothetical protein